MGVEIRCRCKCFNSSDLGCFCFAVVYGLDTMGNREYVGKSNEISILLL